MMYTLLEATNQASQHFLKNDNIYHGYTDWRMSSINSTTTEWKTSQKISAVKWSIYKIV